MEVPLQSLVSRCPLLVTTEGAMWSTRVPLEERVRPKDQHYVLQGGETLFQVAHRFLGDLRLWWVLYDNNYSRLVAYGHPLLIPPGTVLTIPDKELILMELLHDRHF